MNLLKAALDYLYGNGRFDKENKVGRKFSKTKQAPGSMQYRKGLTLTKKDPKHKRKNGKKYQVKMEGNFIAHTPQGIYLPFARKMVASFLIWSS